MSEYQGEKAVIYARYSSHSQTEQSIEGQLHDAYKFAEHNGITIVNEYIDRALSGKKDNRPSFQQLMRDAEKREFTLVLVWKLDRFARNRYDAATYRALLKRNNVRILSVMENIMDTPEGIILEGLLESLAEYYSANLGENIRRGINENIRKGWYKGGPVTFGYKHVDHRLIPEPENVPIVKEIFERYANGELPIRIAEDLTRRGIRNQNGNNFTNAALGRLLDNRTYMGEYLCNGIVVEGCATPIIERELFERAAARRAQNKRSPASNRNLDVHYLLSGKLFCGECGFRMIGNNGTSKCSGIYYYYSCRGRRQHKNDCKMKNVKKAEIEYIVCKIVSDYILNKKRATLEYVADCFMDVYKGERNFGDVEELEAQLKQIEHNLDKLVDSLMHMPDSARPRIAERMEALETQRADIQSKLAKRRLEDNNRYSRDDFVESLQKIMVNLGNEENQFFIIEKFVNCVYLYDDGRIVIYFKRFPGLPYIFEDDMIDITKDSYVEGKEIFHGNDPPELVDLSDFIAGSSLVTYAPPNAGKDEHGQPHLFFLHGRMGIVAWTRRRT
ncbi:MAG: recombinase family protein [Clostridia bacterium]|nr:recombinase family protein [Clostridia bacterium]